MRYIPIEGVKPGMVLGYEIFDDSGHVLIPKGVMLTEQYLDRLKSLHFDGIYINDFITNDIVVEPLISPALRAECMIYVSTGDVDGCKEAASSIVEEILAKDVISFDLMDLRTFDNYTYAHSVNVAVLACVVGIGMNFSEEELKDLVIAGLLHDIGKLQIPQEIMNKPTRLTREEYEVIKTHPMLSYRFIAPRIDISSEVKTAVLSHHENEDGTGYPNGTEGNSHNIFTKILHVVDNYDALVSKRPYKEPYYPFDAAEYLMGGCGFLFDQKVVETFLHYVPFYAKGTQVELSDGRVGIIADNTGDHNLRPVVKLLNGTMVDLYEAQNMNLTIGIAKDEREARMLRSEQERDKMLGRPESRYVKKPRVMVVDDMITNLQAIRTILEDECEITLLKGGQQAIRYIKSLEGDYPDLILMDINMPEINGIDAAERIMKITRSEIPIAFVSAVCDRETVLKCKTLDTAGFIARPYKPGYVRSEVKRILSGR